MSIFSYHAHRLALIVSALVCVLGAGTTCAALVPDAAKRSASDPLLPLDGRGADVQSLVGESELRSLAPSNLTEALRTGRWNSACAIAVKTLAQQQPVVDALGVFAMCAALHNDRKAAATALKRLDEAEYPPHYYRQLTLGILLLKDKSSDKASAVFASLLQQRVDDPLALYFAGEAFYAQSKDAEAVASFKASLKAWPEHAPTHAALARLMAAGNAPKSALQAAIASTERAAKIDPTNPAYWQQLADLLDRADETGRANAIRLLWLTRRAP